MATTADAVKMPLQWRHNERDGVSKHRRLHCLLNCWFRRRSKKTAKLRVIGLCAGNSPVTGEFLAQKASNAENVSIWWRYYGVMVDTFPTNSPCSIPFMVHCSYIKWASWLLQTPVRRLVIQKLVYTDNNKNLDNWFIFRRIHKWLVDSPHKGPVMQKVFACHGVIMNRLSSFVLQSLEMADLPSHQPSIGGADYHNERRNWISKVLYH